MRTLFSAIPDNLRSTKVLMDSLKTTASDTDIMVFALALMSNDNERIKTQFDHLLKNTTSPDELRVVLSRLEPVWVEKINVASGLDVTLLKATTNLYRTRMSGIRSAEHTDLQLSNETTDVGINITNG